MANNQSQYMIKTKQNHNFLDPSDFYVSRQLSRAFPPSLNTYDSHELAK